MLSRTKHASLFSRKVEAREYKPEKSYSIGPSNKNLKRVIKFMCSANEEALGPMQQNICLSKFWMGPIS